METFDTSIKIKCLIEMALKGEISWLAIDPVKLTPTLEKSRQIIKILLKEFEKHQSICTLKTSNDGNGFSEDITNTFEDQSITDEMKMIQGSNYEEFTNEFTEERQVPEQFMNITSEKITSVDDQQDFTNVHAQYESDADFSEADSEVFDENDVSKNIQLVEAFKGQFYTFIGDNSGEKSMANSYNKSLEINSKESKDMRSSFECETCGKCFKTKVHLNEHMKIHASEKQFQCRTCKKFFAFATSLKRHEKYHTGTKPHKCKTCNKHFTLPQHLKRHEMIHKGKKQYACKSCEKCFVQPVDLIKHERIHTGEKPYECKKCKECFSRKFSLTRHEKSHLDEKPHQCSSCMKSFLSSGELQRHERIHTGEKPYQCKTCSKCFAMLHVMKQHEKLHTGEKSYQCKSCDKKFAQTSGLSQHVKKFH